MSPANGTLPPTLARLRFTNEPTVKPRCGGAFCLDERDVLQRLYVSIEHLGNVWKHVRRSIACERSSGRASQRFPGALSRRTPHAGRARSVAGAARALASIDTRSLIIAFPPRQKWVLRRLPSLKAAPTIKKLTSLMRRRPP
jgi:hypothetical protein